MTRPVSWRETAAVIMAVGVASACGGSSATDPTASAGAGSQVQALPTRAFSPPSLGIAVGGTVTWVFGSVGHTVTFDSTDISPPANIGSVSAPNVNVSLSRTFPAAGVYDYHCSIHTFMTGTIIVGNNAVVPPPPPPPPPPPSGYLKTTS
jgi:plastocyanin